MNEHDKMVDAAKAYFAENQTEGGNGWATMAGFATEQVELFATALRDKLDGRCECGCPTDTHHNLGGCPTCECSKSIAAIEELTETMMTDIEIVTGEVNQWAAEGQQLFTAQEVASFALDWAKIERQRREELEIVAAALYLGHREGKDQFEMYRELYS
jgi:hypothetical protein